MPLLPLELNAALKVSTLVMPLNTAEAIWIRTPSVTDEMVDSYTLRCLRYYATYNSADPGAPGWLYGEANESSDYRWRWIDEYVSHGIGANSVYSTNGREDRGETSASIERLIDQGVIQWDANRQGVYVSDPTPKLWWTLWYHERDYDISAIKSLYVTIQEIADSEASLQHPAPYFENWEGWDGPFDTEEQARENVAGYPLRHGFPISSVSTFHIQNSPHWKFREESVEGDFPIKPTSPFDS